MIGKCVGHRPGKKWEGLIADASIDYNYETPPGDGFEIVKKVLQHIRPNNSPGVQYEGGADDFDPIPKCPPTPPPPHTNRRFLLINLLGNIREHRGMK